MNQLPTKLNMVSISRTLVLECFITASLWSSFVVLLDIVTCLIAPRSFFYTSIELTLSNTILITWVDFSCAFTIILFLSLIRLVIGKWLSILINSLVGIAYLSNWATFILVGEFIGFEGFRFVYHNFGQIIWHMAQISRWNLALLLAIVISPLLFYPLINKTNKSFFAKVANTKHIRTVSFILSYLLMIVAFSTIISFKYLPSTVKYLLKFRTSPQLSMFFNRPKPSFPITVDSNTKKLVVSWDKQITWDDYKQYLHGQSPSTPVLLIVIESLRVDLLNNPDIMPNLFDLKRESIFLKAFAPSTVTDYSWPSIFTSHYPMRSEHHYYYPRSISYPKITIYDVLKEFGYMNAIFSAQNELWCGMENYLRTPSLGTFFSANSTNQGRYLNKEDTGFASFVKQFRLAGKIDDGVIVKEAMDWIKQIKTKKFFVGLNFQRSHFPYTWPDSFDPPFQTKGPVKWNYARTEIENMRFRYFNSLRYIDEQIGKIIGFLKDQGLYRESIIIVTGDHGESFYEHGFSCHGNSLYNETAITPVVIKIPEASMPLSIQKIPELIDIAPSILNILKLHAHPSFQGESLFTAQDKIKPIFITVTSPIAKQDAIVYDGWKLIKDHRNNLISLYDLKNDPAERVNLTKTNAEQAQWLLYLLMTWKDEQLKYYSNPIRHRKFYPPKFSIE